MNMAPIVKRTNASPLAAYGWLAAPRVPFCTALTFIVIVNLFPLILNELPDSVIDATGNRAGTSAGSPQFSANCWETNDTLCQ
jgi:hypothetical protein